MYQATLLTGSSALCKQWVIQYPVVISLLMAQPHQPENKLTSIIGLDPLCKLERIKLHVHLGGTRSNGSSTVTGIFRVDEVSALGGDDLGLALYKRRDGRSMGRGCRYLHRRNMLPVRSDHQLETEAQAADLPRQT